jgi:hypothetical protein
MTRSTVLILQYDLPNGLLLLKTLLIYLVIPNTWTWTWSVMMFPINLVVCLIFDKKFKTSLPVIRLKYWLKNPGRSVSTNTNTNWYWFLVGWSGRWWRLEEIVHKLILQTLTRRSKERKNINTHPIDRSSLYLLYFTLAWQSNFQIFNVITD